MKAEVTILTGTAVLAAGVTATLSFGVLSWAAAVLVVAGLIMAHRIGRWMATEADARWLPALLTLAYAAKVVGALIRHYAVTVVYQSGDALGYHRIGLELAEQWRAFLVPTAPGGSAGTRFVQLVTGLFYVPAEPSLFVGGLVFATLGFLGMVALYAAFRRAVPNQMLRRYGLLLFFLPSMLYWPATIGKEALMLLFIGVASYAATGLFEGLRVRSLFIAGLAVLGMAAVRPHVAVMFVAAFVVALVLSRRVGSNLKPVSRALVAVVTLLALWWLTSLAMERLGIEETQGSLDEFLVEQERHTNQGGSAVVGAPVRNPLDVPEATLRVLFRPLPHEAHNPQAVLSALEGAALLSLVVWRLPAMIRSSRRLLNSPYLLFSLIFVLEFVVAYSSILNLGILARQRTQALPFLLAVVIGLGWDHLRQDGKSSLRERSATPALERP